ncbi:MAG: MotA/TolQ/ExbB proton channel family protein [Gammaproteobacteria bacterium]|jgi:biopolymer transport protein ExbB
MKKVLVVAAAAAGFGIGIAQAQDTNPATNLQELLSRVEQGTTRDNAEHDRRVAQFRQNQANQQQELQNARNQRAAEEARSEQLETQFDENELLIADVQAQLDERLGSLRELFGVLQQVSGDARSAFNESLTNVEFPDRSQFLTELAAKMGETTVLPSIEEIERLWYELQREATELGRVKRINGATVTTTTGEQVTEDIVRVGAFNIVGDGKYLAYEFVDNQPRISELQRQPSEARFINSTSAVMNAGPGDDMVRFGVDITRGQVLGLLIAQPTIVERIQQGAEVGYVIIALGIIGVLLAVWRLIALTITGGKVNSQLKRPESPTQNNPLGRVLSVYTQNRSADTETLELKLGEAILKELPALQRGIIFIKIISVVAPLLGLLGTVTGMIETFQAMALFGTGDASVMAGGISQALMTTVLGLVVAIPTVLLHTFVNGRSRSIIQVLQEQSAGLVAAQSERAAAQ